MTKPLPFRDAHILIIDDQPSNLAVLQTILREAGYRHVRELLDPKQSALAFDEFRPDIILLDWLMPEVDGRAVLSLLESRLQADSCLPVIVLTADSNPSSRRVALAAGARDFVTKPFDLSEVLLRIRNHLETRLLHLREMQTASEAIRLRDALIDQASDAIIVLDPENRITYWNRGAENTFGWLAAETAMQRITSLFPVIHSEFIERQIDLHKSSSWSGLLTLDRKDGKKVQVASRWSTLVDVTGGCKSTLVICTDVTEAKRLEAQAYRAQRLTSIGTMAGGIAHDISNALNPIATASGMLRYSREDLDPDVTELLDITDICIGRATDLLRKILAFARGAPPQQRTVDLGMLIKSMVGMLQKTIRKTINVQHSLQEDLWSVNADPTEIDQVLMNLCINARDAMPSGGSLSVHASNIALSAPYSTEWTRIPPGNYVRITVSDTGIGMTPEVLQHIFDPFFTTKPAGQGTGLGLSVCHGIVKNHGGYLTVASEIDRGSTFAIYLPAIPIPARGTQRALDAFDSSPVRNLLGRVDACLTKETILVADDEESVRVACAKILETVGYRVLQARDGVEAVALLTEHQAEITAILTDLYMPGLNGLELASAVTKQAPQVRCILMSGSAAPDVACESYLKKPFTPDGLLNTLRQAIAMNSP